MDQLIGVLGIVMGELFLRIPWCMDRLRSCSDPVKALSLFSSSLPLLLTHQNSLCYIENACGH
jgi:hypothetical protein